MKRILILHTGGTFGMVPMEPDEILVPGNLQSEWLSQVPEIAGLAEIDVEIPFNMDSSNVSPREWDILVKTLEAKMDDYDGFVIIHGTDTMAYTASALSFSMLNLRKPLILTGAQRPLARLRSDARGNLIDAIEIATMDIPEVAIVFGQSVLRGNRAVKNSISSYDAFVSANYPLLGRIGLNVDLYHRNMLRPEGALRVLPGFSDEVMPIYLFPGSDPRLYDPLLNSRVKAFLLIGFGAGNIPENDKNWLPFIRGAGEQNKAVFIGSSSLHGKVDLELYAGAREALRAGALGTRGMTKEAALTKLMKLCARYDSAEQIREHFCRDWAGEIEP